MKCNSKSAINQFRRNVMGNLWFSFGFCAFVAAPRDEPSFGGETTVGCAARLRAREMFGDALIGGEARISAFAKYVHAIVRRMTGEGTAS
jgi:hypothetical protein